jgi:DNA-directed RNA polymerase subunit RPC12/RpoP
MKRSYKKGGTTRELKRALGRGEACAKCGLIMTSWTHGRDWKPTPNATHSLYWDECRACGHVQFYADTKVKIDKRDVGSDSTVITKMGRSNRTCTRCGLAMWRWIDKRQSVTWDECPQCGNRTASKPVPRDSKPTGPSYRQLRQTRISLEKADTVSFVGRARSPWPISKRGDD